MALGLLWAVPLATCAEQGADDPGAPNILIILIDDLGCLVTPVDAGGRLPQPLSPLDVVGEDRQLVTERLEPIHRFVEGER